jgi:maltose alpha-D-glucosyltransferase/alpha-amylase
MTAARDTGVGSPIEGAIAALTSERLLAFLSRQRWFAAKAESPSAARVVDWIPLAPGESSLAMTRVEVETASGSSLYQVPIAVRHGTSASPEAVLAIVGRDLQVVDAVHDDEFLALLARGITSGLNTGASSGPRWVIDVMGLTDIPSASVGDALSKASSARDLPSRDHRVRRAGAEQSNTSIIVDDRVIVKLFRRLVPGVHPEVEVTRFLTTAGYTATPMFLGELRFEDERGPTTAGLSQQFVPASVDLWSHALERGRDYFTATGDAPNEFLGEANRLGRTTREMHDALAKPTTNPAFEPKRVSRTDIDRWVQRARQSARESLVLLERQLGSPQFPRDREPEARVLAGRRDDFVAWLDEIAAALGDDLGARTRIHGDLHLGQVLRAPTGELLIIDFEGEPTKSLDERREKTSPLRDVAGMLRSFAYAAATLALQWGSRLQPHVRELRAARWERDVRAAFLDGYLAPADDAGALPSSAADAARLIELFEADKAFYELSYELNNRPSWAWIPMRGISKLLVRQRSH